MPFGNNCTNRGCNFTWYCFCNYTACCSCNYSWITLDCMWL